MTAKVALALLVVGAWLAMAGDARSEAGATPVIAQLQTELDAHLATRRAAERISGLSVHVSLGQPGPTIDLVSGTVSDGTGAAAIEPGTLFEIGSNTKSFTAAVVLQLAGEGKLTLDDRLDRWLPEYPAWADVTIRRLLDMTSPIPDYAGTPAILRVVAADPRRRWTPPELVAAVYPRPGNELPVPKGYYYSNTNYILAGMVAERAGGAAFGDLVRQRLLGPLGLRETFLPDGPAPDDIVARMASGYVADDECQEFEPPDCKVSLIAPLLGRDMRDADLSWAGAAGAIVASPRDLARWFRALYGGRVLVPAELAQMEQLVSMKTGLPIEATTTDDPRGFGLGLAQALNPELGRFWFYEGETLGYRVAHFWWPEDDLLLVLAANSQPPAAEDKLGKLAVRLYTILKTTRTIPCCP